MERLGNLSLVVWLVIGQSLKLLLDLGDYVT